MNLDDQIREVLFKMGQELKIHKLDADNLILEIDYEKYLKEIKLIIDGLKSDNL